MSERELWERLVYYANLLGHQGTRVVAANVLRPAPASGQPYIIIATDSGPSSASELWYKP